MNKWFLVGLSVLLGSFSAFADEPQNDPYGFGTCGYWRSVTRGDLWSDFANWDSLDNLSATGRERAQDCFEAQIDVKLAAVQASCEGREDSDPVPSDPLMSFTHVALMCYFNNMNN